MKQTYFETLDRDEARRAEWRRLDCALAVRTAGSTLLRRWRAAVGYTLIGLGTRLAGDQSMTSDSAMHPCQ
jgi:hypothetical protein